MAANAASFDALISKRSGHMIDDEQLDALRDFLGEALLLLELAPHPNVVSIIGVRVCRAPGRRVRLTRRRQVAVRPELCIVMTYCAHGSLLAALQATRHAAPSAVR